MGSGPWTRFVQNPADEDDFNQNTRRRMDGLGPVRPQLTAEEVKVAYQDAVREDQAQKDRLETQKNGDAFIAGHPEFLDTTPNAQLLLNQMNTMFGKGFHPISHFEQAYNYLRTNTDFLALDKTVVASQQKQAAKQRYQAEQERIVETTFDESADYSTLSLDELKQRANDEIRNQMQRRGEEGGW